MRGLPRHLAGGGSSRSEYSVSLLQRTRYMFLDCQVIICSNIKSFEWPLDPSEYPVCRYACPPAFATSFSINMQPGSFSRATPLSYTPPSSRITWATRQFSYFLAVVSLLLVAYRQSRSDRQCIHRHNKSALSNRQPYPGIVSARIPRHNVRGRPWTRSMDRAPSGLDVLLRSFSATVDYHRAV